MSGGKVGKRRQWASEAASGWSSLSSLSKKDVACQVNFFEEELCLKNTSTEASQTEEKTVNEEMITPLLLEKTVRGN